jgi:type II secretory ATPase GspE/PulE/Tfp pilus assembly ATPase PilB-like protein
MQRIKVLARLPVDDRRFPKDGRFEWKDEARDISAEIRVSMMPTIYGENAVLRLFDPFLAVFTLRELGFSEEQSVLLEKALSQRSGLILAAGPTGSGKTTTLYAMLSHLNDGRHLIVTAEDPVERRVRGIRQIEVGGTSMLEYVTVLRSILRQDPDVIMIGEIRDKESAELAIQCALTGHLVLSTIHASSSHHIEKRLMNMGIPAYLIEATLVCGFSQNLSLKVCVLCQGGGCVACGEKGTAGRSVIAQFTHEMD